MRTSVAVLIVSPPLQSAVVNRLLRLLSIMRLFEAEKHTSLRPFFSQWSLSPDATAPHLLKVVQNFDRVYMLRTCLAFPAWRRFGDVVGTGEQDSVPTPPGLREVPYTWSLIARLAP